MSARAFVVALDGACKKVRINGDPETAVIRVYPELQDKHFKLTYYDNEVEEFVDIDDMCDVPAKSKLVIKTLPSDSNWTHQTTESHESERNTTGERHSTETPESETIGPQQSVALRNATQESSVVEPGVVEPAESHTSQPSESEPSMSNADTVILDDSTISGVTSDVIFDPITVPSALRSKMTQSDYEPSDADDKSLIHIIHLMYTSKSYFPDATGYRLLTESVFHSFPRMSGSAETPEEVYMRKQKFKAKLKNRFKNCRRSVDNAVIDQERKVRGIEKKKRPCEGMPGMCPPYKKTKSEAAQDVARYSYKLNHAEDESARKEVLDESFALRRHLLTRNCGRQTPSQMKEMFPEMFSESALWNDVALIMGSGDDREELKDKVTMMTRQVCDEYASHVLEDIQPTDGDELVALLAYGCQTTIADLEDHRNSVSVTTQGRMNVQGAESNFVLPTSKVAVVATVTAAHAAFYVPFRGPCKALFEVIYSKAFNFNIPLSVAAKKVMSLMDSPGLVPT